jgi:collagenase-like PrtC family protease
LFSVATNFDDELPRRIAGRPVSELFGACDDAPVGHGRPRAVTPPVSWRTLGRHVAVCEAHGIGFNLLLNPLCLDGLEQSVRLERSLRQTLRRAKETGIAAVTVAHPWLVELAAEAGMRIRVSVFVGICTIEQARYWEGLGAHVLALDTHAVGRDLPALRRIVRGLGSAEAELPVNIGCLLRCPIARNHAARLSHSSKPGAQPVDPCVVWCRGEKRRDPYHVVRSDFIRPEDLGRYEAVGIRHFKIVDRSCSTDALVERVEAYAGRRWDGDLLDLLGPKGSPPRRRRLPVLDGLRHLGLRRSLASLRDARRMIDPTLPWTLDNRELGDLLLPSGCAATRCDECGHCREIARRVVRPRTA